MKVGLVIHRFDPDLGGAERWTHAFAHWLLQQGCEVHVLARSFSASSTNPQIRYESLNSAHSRLDFAAKAALAGQRLAFDVLHDMGAGYAADIFQPHGGLPAAVHQRGLAASPVLWRRVRRWATLRTRRRREFTEITRRQAQHPTALLIAVSHLVANDFAAVARFPKERLRVIYNGVNTAHYEPNASLRSGIRSRLEIGDEEVMLLFVGNNFRLKGLKTLMHATAMLARDGLVVRLCVVGRDQSAPWRRRAHRLGIIDRVSFHAELTDVGPFYAASDIFVLPSLHDSCSLSVLEAMASGAPVVTSATNGASELLSHGEDGIVIQSPESAEELARQLSTLVRGRGLRQSIARRAIQTIQGHSQTKNFENVFAVYQEVIEARRTAHRGQERLSTEEASKSLSQLTARDAKEERPSELCNAGHGCHSENNRQQA